MADTSETRSRRVHVNEKYRQKFIDLVQASVGELILAVAVLQPESSWRASATSMMFSSGVGLGMQEEANQRAGGLARTGVFSMKMALLAVTGHEVHVFSVKPRATTGFKLVEQVAAWRRDDLRIEVTAAGLSASVYLEVIPANEAYELEATMVGTLRPINQQLFDVCSQPSMN